MVTTQFQFQDVKIVYDPNAASDQTVLRENFKVGGTPITGLLQGILGQAGGSLESAKQPLSKLLTHLFDSVWALDTATPNSLVARDAADRIHETLLSPIWLDLTNRGLDKTALDFMIWGAKICTDWESSVHGSPRYVHKGGLYYWAATSALRLRNVDLGLLLLEAGDLSDTTTYGRAGLPGGETERPGAYILRLDPNSSQMLHADVVALRSVLNVRLTEFSTGSGVPSTDPLALNDLDTFLLGDRMRRTPAKFVVAYLLWTSFLIDEPALSTVPRGGEYMSRRKAELLFGLLTATEELIRSVEGSAGKKGKYSRVIARLVAPDWTPQTAESSFQVLNAVETSHHDSVDSCLKFWSSPLPATVPSGIPWYVQWLESGRFIRNKIAHSSEAPSAIQTNWPDLERVAWFSLYSAVWLLRRKNPGTRRPIKTTPATFTIPVSQYTSTASSLVPSGITLMNPIVTDPGPVLPQPQPSSE
jgi:hypothetical protein